MSEYPYCYERVAYPASGGCEALHAANKQIQAQEAIIAGLVEALEPFANDEVFEFAQGIIEDDEERRPKSHNPQSVNFSDEFGFSGLKAIDFLKARQALSQGGEG